MTFKNLGVIDPILRALRNEGYTSPTPIQGKSIPILLDRKDLLGCAQTGTGKTAAFTIPIIQHLHLSRFQNKGHRKIKSLIVTPTRELAIQIAESISTYARYTGIKNTVIFGGVKQKNQTDALRRGTDILVATPGRLLDLISQGFISLKDVKYFVLDEADQMLDMGFIHDIKKIVAKLPANRQSLFFSATMPPSIIDLSGRILGNPEKVTISPKQATAEKVDQEVYFVQKRDKSKLLIHLIETVPNDSILVFSRTKHGADKIVKVLGKNGIKSAAIHGNKSQGARQRALGNFKKGDLNILIATDIAARGIDVDELSLVINFNLPNIPETYVHRIGRTGRASASGLAISFCDGEEKAYLKDIQKLIRQNVPVVEEHPFVDDGTEILHPPKQSKNQRKKNKRRSEDGTKPPEKSKNKHRRKFYSKRNR
jgi:ATP-dependent RNA helicase RhlE